MDRAAGHQPLRATPGSIPRVDVLGVRISAIDMAQAVAEITRWLEDGERHYVSENFLFSGAGIFVFNSAEVEVYENLVYDNDNGILIREDGHATRWAQASYREGLPDVERVTIHDNDVKMLRGFTGMRVDGADARDYWRPPNVRFAGNTYRLDDGEGRFLGAGNDVYTLDEWQNLGNDRTGTLASAASDGSLPDRARAFATSVYGAQPAVAQPNR